MQVEAARPRDVRGGRQEGCGTPGKCSVTIYAPMICTALCTMFWMRAYPLLGQVGGGWALEFSSFLGPVKWHQADRRVPFGA